MLHCTKCGHANTAQSNFCSNCGERLERPLEAQGDQTSVISVVPEAPERDDLSAEEQAAVSSLPAGSALLIVRRGSASGARYLIDADITIAGRHPDAEIFLDDITVSRHHAEFQRADGKLSVRDLGSLNGTYVNRKLADGAATLKTGDEVQIGKFRLIVFVGAPGRR